MSSIVPLSESHQTGNKAEIRLKVVSNQLQSGGIMSAPRSPVTTHVLNTATGRPAANLLIKMYRVTGTAESETLSLINSGRTNVDGRLPGLLTKEQFTAGIYKIRFETQDYFSQTGTEGFYPYAEVIFTIKDVDQHYHIPLLLSPYSYSTYRGS